MISIIKLLLEVTPTQAKKDAADTMKAGGNIGPGAKFSDPTPEQDAEKAKMGVPKDAKHAGFGRWVNSTGKTIGFTRNGKFVKAAPDADKKAMARVKGVHDPKAVAAMKLEPRGYAQTYHDQSQDTADPERSQAARTANAKIDQLRHADKKPSLKLIQTAINAAERISKKMGIDMNGGVSKEQSELQSNVLRNKLPTTKNPNESSTDGTVAYMPLKDYQSKYANGANDKEIEAVSKYNAKFPQNNPRAGVPVGVETDDSGERYVLLRTNFR